MDMVDRIHPVNLSGTEFGATMKSARVYLRWWMLFFCLAIAPLARAQQRPYIGFVYPAGGQQGTTIQIRVGGQGLDDLNKVFISGPGVSARIVEYHRVVNNEEAQLMREQVAELKRFTNSPQADSAKIETALGLKARIESRLGEIVGRPACASIANFVVVEVTFAADAKPGQRELRLGTLTGISNPLVFNVGQYPEVSRKPMLTAEFQVLGKEELALRKRPIDEREVRVNLPCTVNGQLSSAEMDQYRFRARKGQQLVISVLARQLIPFIADAVPGWCQPVLSLADAAGREVAYADEYRSKPDPIIFYTVPEDGEYVFSIHDSIFRGREDFVYRITAGEQPFVTSVFPLGERAGNPADLQMKGVNLRFATLAGPGKCAEPGIVSLEGAEHGVALNRLPFEVDTLPECTEAEPNSDPPHAQKVTLPVIINGRIDKPDDWDIFEFAGHQGETVVAEVLARRLDSPLDSVLKLTDASGAVLAFNDDREDAGAGINTHHADSYLTATLPADGRYFVHLGDTGRSGGEEFGYRLRLSAPRPDFALRVVPSSIAIRGKSSANLTVHAIRKDGYTGPIIVSLTNAPEGVTSSTLTLTGTNVIGVLTIKTALMPEAEPVDFDLTVVGTAKMENRTIVHAAVPAEDRMQAFLWRHLVPATELKALVYNPGYRPALKRIPLMLASLVANASAKDGSHALASRSAAPAEATPSNGKKFTKGQVATRLRDLKRLLEEGLITDDFYMKRVAECEAAM